MGMTTGRGVHEFLDSVWPYHSSSVFHSVGWFILGGGTIERSCYSPHYVNTERDYERDYQATLPQGRTAANGCKPRHGRDDRKQALLPSARYERRVGVSLVRAAWERRPEGPAYLLSSVTLLYLAGLCAF